LALPKGLLSLASAAEVVDILNNVRVIMEEERRLLDAGPLERVSK
jgi:hypothetical protein